MKRVKIFIVLGIGSMITGCFQNYYPVIYHQVQIPTVFAINDSLENFQKFVSVDIQNLKGSQDLESIHLIRSNFIIAKTSTYNTINAGVYGYGGVYNSVPQMILSDDDTERYGYKNVFGFGFDLRGSLNFKIYAVKIGAGLFLISNYEFGEYTNFIKVQNKGYKKIYDESIYTYFGWYPNLQIAFSEQTKLAIEAKAISFFGGSGLSLSLNHNDYIYWLTLGNKFKPNNQFPGQEFQLGFMVNTNKFGW